MFFREEHTYVACSVLLKFIQTHSSHKRDQNQKGPSLILFLCGFHAVSGYEQMDALFTSQSAAVHQVSSAKEGRDRFVREFSPTIW